MTDSITNFRRVSSPGQVGQQLASTLTRHLQAGERVVWFLTGGAGIAVAVAASQALTGTSLKNLTVSLSDERFGPVGHADSNWFQLEQAGFHLPGAQLEPVLINKDLEATVEHYDQLLRKCLEAADFAIGLFGIGPDGHIASLFPGFPQLHETQAFATSVDNSPKPPPIRVTMTVPAIEKLDEAVVYTLGEAKWPQVDKLATDVSIDEQPAQILKRIPKLTVYNDHKGDSL